MSEARLQGRIAVVTGGASGMGAGTVRRLVQDGARVVLADIQGDTAELLAKDIGPKARAVRADVSSEANVAAITADLRLGNATTLDKVSELMARDAAGHRPGLPEDLAAAVSYLASDDAAFVTGQTLTVDGGYTSIAAESPFSTGDYAGGGAFFEAGRRG
jgi:NAD(P)-dependent dehydrogenase (short-subunit alcohol dehydrogenase family)